MTTATLTWETLCSKDDLIANSGVCALVGDKQIAIFYLPGETPEIYALGNWDPIGKANIMSRGIIGSIGPELVVASPLYKEHYSLMSGVCLEKPEFELTTYPVRIEGDAVQVQA